MPIHDIQRSLREVGRIRCGDQTQTGKGRAAPRKLERFRFTSDDQEMMHLVAELYGGDVEPWEGAPQGSQWQCYVSAERIPVMIVPGLRPLSQWWEAWTGGGCVRRCDGERERINDVACQCVENGERICKPTTRLSVILPDVPGLGMWRLETHGYYAAAELGGTVELITKVVAATQETVYGTLRLTQRTQKTAGQPVRHFAVPTLDIATTVPRLAALVQEAQPQTLDASNADRVRALAVASHPSAPAFPTEQDREAAEGRYQTKLARKRTPPMGPGKRAGKLLPSEPPEWVGPVDEAVREVVDTEPQWRDPPSADDVRAGFDSPLSDRQRTAIQTLFRMTGLDDRDERLLFAARLIGRSISSSKELTSNEASRLIDTLTAVETGAAKYVADAGGRIVGARAVVADAGTVHEEDSDIDDGLGLPSDDIA